MQKASRIIIYVHIILFFLVFSYSHAQIYQYKDEEGTVHFTNVPTDKRFKLLDKNKDVPQRRGKKIQPHMLNDTIHTVSKRHRVDPDLVKAVIKVESDFDPNAISSAGALGLMQLMPETSQQLMLLDPFDPEENIEAGVRYLSHLLDSFDGDLKMSLAAYNAGENLVKKFNSIPPITETRKYVKKVLSYYKDFGGKTKKNGIYKVVSKDGGIIYTNKPEHYQANRDYPAKR